MAGGELALTAEDRERMLAEAVECYSASDLGRAEQVLQGVLALEPSEPRAWQLMGSILAVQGYRVAAEQAYLRALEGNPEDLYSLAALAEIALDALRLEDAKNHLAKLFSLDPNGTHPAANRGRKILAEALEKFGSE